MVKKAYTTLYTMSCACYTLHTPYTTRYSEQAMTKAREILFSQGRTVQWCANQLCMDRAELSKILNGHKPLPPRLAERLAALLGVPVTWLDNSRAEVPA